MWRNTAATALAPGHEPERSRPSTLGYEWDVDADNGFRPAGAVQALLDHGVSGLEVFTDYGSTVKQGGTATHNLTMYKAPSGARVFNAGTVQWSWGLDDSNPDGNAADRNMQQATVNLFADLGSQPATLRPGLVAAAATTDTTAPTATRQRRRRPASPTARRSRSPAPRRDARRRRRRGRRGLDRRRHARWHPATGTTSWSYTWMAHGSPSSTIRARARPTTAATSAPRAPACPSASTARARSGAPNIDAGADHADSGDPTPIEVGVKFRSDAYGTVTGIRFYKAAANTGTHIGSLWTADGQRLAQVTFTGETASGWQTATFSTPVEVQPNTTYVASYYAPERPLRGDARLLPPRAGAGAARRRDRRQRAAARPAEHRHHDHDDDQRRLLATARPSTFPLNSFGAANYWVDVRFSPAAAPGAVTDVTAVDGGHDLGQRLLVGAHERRARRRSYKITPYVGATAQTPKTITGSPPATTTTVTGLTTGTTYRFTVQALNPNGGGPVSPQSNPVTPAGAVVPAAPTGVAAAAGVAVGAGDAGRRPPPTVTARSPGTRSRRTSARPPRPPTNVGASATSATITGLTNGTALHVQGHGDERRRHRARASAASAAVTPQATIFDFTRPGRRPTPATRAPSSSASSSGPTPAARSPASASTSPRPTRAPTRAACGARPARASPRPRSRTSRPPAGSTSRSPARSPSRRARPTSRPTTPPAGTTRPRAAAFSTRGRQPAAARAGHGHEPERRLRLRRHEHVPRRAPTTRRTTGSTCSTRCPSPARSPGVTAERGRRTSASVSWTAPAGGAPVTGYRITPYVGSTAQTAEDDHRLAARDEHDGRPG